MTRLTFEYDSEPYGKERDGAIVKMAREFGVETIVRHSHTLYNPDRSEIFIYLFIFTVRSKHVVLAVLLGTPLCFHTDCALYIVKSWYHVTISPVTEIRIWTLYFSKITLSTASLMYLLPAL